MKKKHIILLVILSVFVTLITCTVFFATSLNVYIINEDVCTSIFKYKTPKEFCEARGKETYLEDYIFATVDKDQNLVLILTDKQLKKWISSSPDLKALDIVTGGRTGLFEDYEINMGDNVEKGLLYDFNEGTVKVSDDYKTIIITYGEMHEIFFSFFEITNGCIHMQLLNGTPSEDITLQLVVVKENGEIVTDSTWPSEDLVYNFSRE